MSVLRRYTVVGFYSDNLQIWIEKVVAHNDQEAITNAANQLRNWNGVVIGDDPDHEHFNENCQIVGVFAESIRELSGLEQVCNVKELLEMWNRKVEPA